ncbi:MAG TPA: GNAT family N-acetyltransferase, partial [Vulgatibacter sp.]
MMAAEFIGPEDVRWAEFLEAVPHDVYHLPPFVELDAAAAAGRAVAFLGEVDGARCLIPLIEQPIPRSLGDWSGHTDLASPYGYPHPLIEGDAKELGACLRLFARACRERGSVSAFLRNHPVLSPAGTEGLVWKDDATESRINSRGDTLVVDLRGTRADIRSGLRSEYRRRLNRLLRMGYHAVVDDWSRYDRFVEVYAATMDRVGAARSYFYDRAYFEETASRLKGNVHLVSVLSPNGSTVVAAGLFFREGNLIQYHLGGWDPAYAPLSPSKLVLWSAIEWGHETGATWLHLG